MKQTPNANRIFLVGFMCSGKTTAGELLAKRLGWRFVDIDKEIERKEGISIPDIFEQKGEVYFRELEIKMLKELSQKDRIVVSTGGGLGANPRAMELMKDKGIVVWLKISFKEFLKRCGGDKNRPLLKLGKERLKELLRKREEIYSQAHIRIDMEDSQNVVERIIGFIVQLSDPVR